MWFISTLICLSIRFQQRKRSSSYWLSSRGRVGLWPLRSIQILLMRSHYARGYLNLFFYIGLVQYVARSRVCSYPWFGLLYVQATSIGTLILVQGSLGATTSTRDCYHKKNCRPAQQPLECKPWCKRVPEMVKSWSRPYFFCSRLSRSMFFWVMTTWAPFQISFFFYISSGLQRNFGATSALVFTEVELITQTAIRRCSCV